MTTPTATRRAALAAAALVGLRPSSASAADPLSVRFDFLPYGSHAPFHLAQEKGWFAEANVQPTFEDGNGSATAVQLVEGGRHDVAYVSLASAMIARDRGMGIKAVAGVLRKSDLGVLVDERGPIRAPKDLEGKQIYFSPNSVETLFIDTWFRMNGVERSRVNLTALDVGAKVSTYLGGGADGMFVPLPIYTIRHNIPRLSRGIAFADHGLSLPGFGIIASEAAMQRKAPAIRGFLAAMSRAWAGVKDGTMLDEAVAALQKARPQSRLDALYIRQQLEAVVPYMDTPATASRPLFWQATDDWAAGLRGSVEAGAVRASARAADFFTNDFLPAAR